MKAARTSGVGYVVSHIMHLRNALRPSLLLLLVLLATACAGGPPGRWLPSSWKFQGAEEHPALREGVAIVTWTKGLLRERETVRALRTTDGDVSIDAIDELVPHCRPLDDPSVALAYADLVRRLGVTGTAGIVVRPDADLKGTGGSGRYARADAAAWGIEFAPTPRPFGGGFEVTILVLVPPVPHQELPVATPWRLVELREVVYPDGTLDARASRTLTNGDDAERFARF